MELIAILFFSFFACVFSFFAALIGQLQSCRKRQSLLRKLILPLVLVVLLVLTVMIPVACIDALGIKDAEEAGGLIMIALMVAAGVALLASIPFIITLCASLGCLLAWIIFGFMCIAGTAYPPEKEGETYHFRVFDK